MILNQVMVAVNSSFIYFSRLSYLRTKHLHSFDSYIHFVQIVLLRFEVFQLPKIPRSLD